MDPDMVIRRIPNGFNGEIAELYRLEDTGKDDVMVKWRNSVINSAQYHTCRKRKYKFDVVDTFVDKGKKMREVHWKDTLESVEYIQSAYRRDATVMKKLSRLVRNNSKNSPVDERFMV